MKKPLYIFDFDGTLYDTAPLNTAAYVRALADNGISVTEEAFRAAARSRYYKDFLPELIGGPDPELMEKIHRDKKAVYRTLYPSVRENKALFRLIQTLSGRCHICIVSTASRESVLGILEAAGRASLFELILAQEDIPRKKPAPDGFLMAMRHFGAEREDTLIFEDSEEGLEAARRAGVSCMLVTEFAGEEKGG